MTIQFWDVKSRTGVAWVRAVRPRDIQFIGDLKLGPECCLRLRICVPVTPNSLSVFIHLPGRASHCRASPVWTWHIWAPVLCMLYIWSHPFFLLLPLVSRKKFVDVQFSCLLFSDLRALYLFCVPLTVDILNLLCLARFLSVSYSSGTRCMHGVCQASGEACPLVTVNRSTVSWSTEKAVLLPQVGNSRAYGPYGQAGSDKADGLVCTMKLYEWNSESLDEALRGKEQGTVSSMVLHRG